MFKQYYHDIDLVKNSILNAKFNPLSTSQRTTLGGTLTTSDKGIVVYDTNDFHLYSWNGTSWDKCLTLLDAGNFIDNQNTIYQPANFKITGTGTIDITGWPTTDVGLTVINHTAGFDGVKVVVGADQINMYADYGGSQLFQISNFGGLPIINANSLEIRDYAGVDFSGHYTSLVFQNPTTNAIVTIKNQSGTIALLSDIPTSLAPSGPAGGSLGGTYPNPIIVTNANLTGDVTSIGNATTLATVNSNVGSVGDSSHVGTFTVNAKGLITAASNISIQIAESQVTNLISDLSLKLSITSAASTYMPFTGGTFTGDVQQATAPVNSTSLINKAYVDSIIIGVIWVGADADSTSNITLSGEQTINGITTSASRVFVHGQTDQTQNGIYISSSGAWSRASDASTGAQIIRLAVLIEGGTNKGQQWVNTNSSVTVGTTNITFGQNFGLIYSAGTGLQITSGTVFSIDNTYTATAGRTGYLSSTDWSDFNSRLTTTTGITTSTTQTGLTGAKTTAGIWTFSNGLIAGSGQIGTKFVSVKTSLSGSGLVGYQNTSNTGYTSFDLYDDATVLQMSFGHANSGTAGTLLPGNNYINSNSSVPLIFAANTAEVWRYTSTAITSLVPITATIFVGTSLTASTALVSDASKNIVSSATTSTQIGYLSTTTSDVQIQLNSKEPGITVGTTAQYWRGDKTFQNLNPAVIASTLIGYTSGAGTVSSSDSILGAIQKLNGNILAVTGSLTNHSVIFAGVSGVLSQDNSNFYYDSSTHLLSVSTGGDFNGTNSINIYGQYDSYQPQSAIGLFNNATTTPGFTVSTSRGTGASPIIVNTGDLIGGHSYWAYTGSSPAYTYMAGIVGTAVGTTAANLGGQLDFYVKANAGSASSAMTILNNSSVGIGITNPSTARLTVISTTGPQLRLGYNDTDSYIDFTVDTAADRLTITSHGSGGDNLLIVNGGATFHNVSASSFNSTNGLNTAGDRWFGGGAATSIGNYIFAGGTTTHIVSAFSSQTNVYTVNNSASWADAYFGSAAIRTPSSGAVNPWISEVVMIAAQPPTVTPGSNIPTNTSALYLAPNPNEGAVGTNNWSSANNWTLYAAGPVGISTNANGFTKIPSSLFTINTTTKGSIPIPSMTTTQQNAISSPIESLWIYDNTLHGPAYYNGTSWINIATGFVPYTGAISDVNIGAHKLGIGTTPAVPLHIIGAAGELLRIGSSSTGYVSFSVGSGGALTVTQTLSSGGNIINFSGISFQANSVAGSGGVSAGSFFSIGAIGSSNLWLSNNFTTSTSTYNYGSGSTTTNLSINTGYTSPTGIAVGNSFTNVFMGTSSIHNNTTGTHPWWAEIVVAPPLLITNHGATITNSTGLYLKAAATYATNNYSMYSEGKVGFDTLTASKVVFSASDKSLTSTGIGTSSQFIKGDGSLDSSTYASTATTLAGYGITDAYTKTAADARYLLLTGGSLTGQLNSNGSAIGIFASSPIGNPSIYMTNVGIKVGTTDNLTHNYTSYNNNNITTDNGTNVFTINIPQNTSGTFQLAATTLSGYGITDAMTTNTNQTSLSGNKKTTGDFTTTSTFNALGSGVSSPDGMGPITVTMPADSNSYSYFGITRSSATAIGIGMDNLNAFIIGDGTGRGNGATITNVKLRMNTATGDLSLLGNISAGGNLSSSLGISLNPAYVLQWGISGNFGQLVPPPFTAPRNWLLPDESGTIAIVYHGNSTTTGTATTTVTVTIGSTMSGTNYFISITPRDLLTAINYYISAKTTTTFDITFTTAVTGSINFDWIVITP